MSSSIVDLLGALALIVGASGLLRLRGAAPPSGERLR